MPSATRRRHSPLRTPRSAFTRHRRLLLESLENRALLAAIAPPDGLVSWWTADTTAADLAGVHNGTLIGGATYGTGKVGQAFSLDGINDTVLLAGEFGGGPEATIEAWVKSTGGTGDFQAIVSAVESYFVHLQFGDDGNNVAYTNTGVIGFPIIEPRLEGEFRHVAMSLKSGDSRLYVNGDLVGVSTLTYATLLSTSNLRIGSGYQGGRFFKGEIDEVSYYDRALSAGEIQDIYTADSDGKIKPAAIVADHLTVSEGSGSTTSLATFTINRTGNLAGELSVDWATVDGTALAGSDYVAATGQIVFQDGQSQQTIEITVNGDSTKERDEFFGLALSTAAPGYVIGEGPVTISNDDFLGLVSHWTGDNTAVDAVGLNHGTQINGATYAAGQIGQAFRFDGVNDRVPDSESLRLTSSMTIEGWIKANSVPVSGQQGEIFFRGDDRGGLDPYSLSVQSNGMLRFEVVSGSAAMNLWATMPLGQFVHVACTLDDETGAMRLYLNGVLMSQATTAVRPFADLDPASNPSIGIGNHGGYPSTPHNFPFDGLIDDLKVYDVPLSDAQVLANFNVTKGSLQPSIKVSDASVVEGNASFKYLGNSVNQGDGGLDNPNQLTFGPDGSLYVGNPLSGVFRYDGTTGNPLPAPAGECTIYDSQLPRRRSACRHW